METSKNFKQFFKPILAAAAFAVLALFTWQSVRLIDYPKNPEVFRDYLISRHIIQYSERPLTGPYNMIFPALRNSPTYPYLWAIFSAISFNPVFLTLINIAMQVIGMWCLYLVGKRLFGTAAAAFGLSIYAATWVWFTYTTEVWQPYTMQAFLLIGLWLFVKALQERQYWTLNFAFVVLVFAATFHYSVFAILPALTIIAWYRIYRDYKSFWALTGPLLSMAIAGGLFYLPVFINLWQQGGTTATLGASNLIVDSAAKYLVHFSENVWLVLDAFFVRFGALPLWRGIALGAVGTAFIAVLIQELLSERRNERVIYFLLMLAVILQPLVLSAFFNAPRWQYYFIPVLGLTALGIGYVIRTLFSDNLITWALRVALVIILIYVASGNFYVFSQKPALAQSQQEFLVIKTELVKTIEEVKIENGFSDYSFFQFWVYQNGNPFRSHDAQFWSLLEDHYNRQFVELINAGNGYWSTNQSQYLFFSCYNFSAYEQQDCLTFIQANNPGYEIEKTVFMQGHYSMYLAHFQTTP